MHDEDANGLNYRSMVFRSVVPKSIVNNVLNYGF